MSITDESAAPKPDDVVAVAASVVASIYGDTAHSVADRQVEATEGEMRERWVSIRAALTRQ